MRNKDKKAILEKATQAIKPPVPRLLTCSRDVDEQQEIHTPMCGGGSCGKYVIVYHCACDCKMLYAKIRRSQDTAGASDLLRKC